MGLITQNEHSYYSDERNSGNYQFTDLDTIINQFIVSYVGEDKLISKVKKTDVAFHAQRALQELSFDTFKSIKSQELTVPPSLRLMLPQDYVNYTNISWVDAAGVQRTIYPISKVSNPQRKGNFINNSSFNKDADKWTLGTGWEWTNYVSSHDNDGGAILGTSVAVGEKLSIPVDVKMGRKYKLRFDVKHPVSSGVPITTPQAGNLKISLYGDEGYKWVNGDVNGTVVYVPTITGTEFVVDLDINLITNDINFQTTTDSDSKTLVIEPGTIAFTGIIDNIVLIDDSAGHFEKNNLISSSFGKYRSRVPYNNHDDYIDDTHWRLDNERYGLDPQYAHVNGSFFIDNDILHFSSNISGKNIVLKYISDSLGTDQEMQVHKFAEEAVYKWIAYAIVSTRANMPQFQILRLKKEKFAETRKAKLRLSNLKLEELTQILRGKSKWIKH